MADGFLCKWCGHQETTHIHGFFEAQSDEEVEKEKRRVNRGYRMSFERCPGFTLSKRDQTWSDRQYREGERKLTERSRYINHSVWAIIPGYGVIDIGG